MDKYYLISGASSGIGRAMAEDLAQKGHHVFATAPTDAERQRLSGISERIIPLLLDLRSEEHITQLKQSILQYTDRLDGIVNNAGVGLGGPVELLNVDDIRTLFDINVLGHIKMTQVFLPLLRKAERGRVVFTGSVAGFLSLPLQSPYAASKFALRAFCDALRVELRPQNIRVSLIQPGMIKTPIWSKSPLAGIEEHPQADRYRTSIQKSYALLRDGAKSSASVSIVTKAMNHALFSPFPKAKYLVGHDARLAYCARILPTFLFDLILIRFYL